VGREGHDHEDNADRYGERPVAVRRQRGGARKRHRETPVLPRHRSDKMLDAQET
jgi:hypothetical protein